MRTEWAEPNAAAAGEDTGGLHAVRCMHQNEFALTNNKSQYDLIHYWKFRRDTDIKTNTHTHYKRPHRRKLEVEDRVARIGIFELQSVASRSPKDK